MVAAVFLSLAVVAVIKCMHGGGGGYQGAPSFFPAYSQQPPPAMLQARSVKMLGSNAAADSRAGDPGEWR